MNPRLTEMILGNCGLRFVQICLKGEIKQFFFYSSQEPAIEMLQYLCSVIVICRFAQAELKNDLVIIISFRYNNENEILPLYMVLIVFVMSRFKLLKMIKIGCNGNFFYAGIVVMKIQFCNNECLGVCQLQDLTYATIANKINLFPRESRSNMIVANKIKKISR